jgi:hypothetical protein
MADALGPLTLQLLTLSGMAANFALQRSGARVARAPAAERSVRQTTVARR